MDLEEVPQARFRRHPWEIARARFFGRVVVEAIPAERPARVLDVGAGDGYLARELLGALPRGSAIACVDARYTDRQLAAPGAPGQTFSRAPPPGSFDAILLLDVVEHLADDRAFLDEMVERLQPGGAVILSVPAWDLLYGAHDLALKHFRRYQPEQARALLRACGLEIVRDGGLFPSLLLPRVLQRLSETALGALRPGRRGGRPGNLGEWRGGALLSSVVTLALEVDMRLSEALARAGRALPGLSYWALGRREAA